LGGWIRGVSVVSSLDNNLSALEGGIVKFESLLLVLVRSKFNKSITKAVTVSLLRDGQLVDLQIFSEKLF